MSEAQQTALGQALRGAGFIPPAEQLAVMLRRLVRESPEAGPPIDWTDNAARARLKEVALNAVRQNPRNWDGARDALFREVRGDAALLWELFAPFRNDAAQMVLTAAASEMRHEELARQGQRGAGHQNGGDRTFTARPPRNAPATGPGDAGHPPNGGQFPFAGIAAVTTAARRSLLETFMVNGQPIGQVTTREAIAWAGARRRDARFVERLTENLPMDAPIGRFRTAEEAERLYDEAVEASDAE
jgi:hypothetical protein